MHRRKAERLRLQASGSNSFRFVEGVPAGLELTAAEGDAPNKPKRFTMTAYTGGTMNLPNFPHPVVVDLAGTKAPRQDIAILRDHLPTSIVGHTDGIEISSQRIKLSGFMSGTGDAAKETLSLAANGFPWQASIGGSVEKTEYVERGETVKVNGRNFTGPVHVVRAMTLREVSFVPIGADGATSASVAAHYQGEKPMFEKWLTAKGFDPAALTESQRSVLQAAFDAEEAAKKATATPAPAQTIAASAPANVKPNEDAEIQASRDRRVAEALRVEAIGRICAKYNHPRWSETDGSNETSLEAKAIAAGWTEKETHLEALLRDRGTGAPNFIMATQKRDAVKPDVLEASLAMSRSLPNIEKQYKPETLEAAHRHFHNFGLQQLLLTAAAANGYHVGPGTRISNGNVREVLHAAFSLQAGAFSTVPLPNILGNVANKELLSGYMEEDQTWREIAGIKSVSNFHQVTSYRMLDDMTYEKLGPAGEIAHGKVSEESYTRQADTYAKMFALTRRDIINDDLGAFDDLRNRLGRGSAQKFNDVFWTEVLADGSTNWTTARTNYITGATTTLLTDGVGLGLGVKAFRQMTSPSGDGSKRIGGRPEILLVPPELEYAARNLFASQNLVAAGGSSGATVGAANIYANQYRPVVSAWLSDSNFTGYSATAWYLLRSPTIMPMIVVSFLNGMQTPTVESAEADFNTLGIQFRGYHDFGCDFAEYLCGVKSKGAA